MISGSADDAEPFFCGRSWRSVWIRRPGLGRAAARPYGMAAIADDTPIIAIADYASTVIWSPVTLTL
jgi:hypothetical protein